MAMIALPLAGLLIEELVMAGMAISVAIGVAYGYQVVTKAQAKTVDDVLIKIKKQGPEIHKAWEQLEKYKGKTRRGYSSKGKLYYYQYDYLHGDVEVYKLYGSTGHHIGSVKQQGGPIYKGPVPGRTINL